MRQDSASLERIAAEAADWFTAIRTGELSPAERQRFVAWLEVSPLHVQEYIGVAETWGALISANAWPTASAEDLINAAKGTTNVVMLPASRERAKERTVRNIRPLRFAAVVLLSVVGVVVAAAMLVSPWGHTYATTRGEQRSIVLEDGSVVQLNTLSRISVRFTDQQRRIELESGEAYFRVAHDVGRPFDVVTPVATVRAVGTEFNVYSRDDTLQVAVVDGRVKVAPVAAATPTGEGIAAGVSADISLGARETVELRARGVPARDLARSPAAATAWMQRRLVFENERLDDVIAEFNRYTSQTMQVTDPALAGLRISGTFDADEPETLVAYLEQIQNVHVAHNGASIVFAPKEKPDEPRGRRLQ